jgi:hypothetical protein
LIEIERSLTPVRNISSVFFLPSLSLSFPFPFPRFLHLVKCVIFNYYYLFYVEAECDESRGMGTKAHRETKRVTRMGCRTRAAVEPEPNRSIRRLGTKDLTAWVSCPPSGVLVCLSTIHYLLHSISLLSYFYFSTPGPVCYTTIVTYMTNLQIPHEHAARVIQDRTVFSTAHASRIACVNPRTERTPPNPGPNILQSPAMTFCGYRTVLYATLMSSWCDMPRAFLSISAHRSTFYFFSGIFFF